MKKLIVLALLLTACAADPTPERYSTTPPPTCTVYSVTYNKCDDRAELVYIPKTNQCFMVVVPRAYSEWNSGGTMGVAIIQVEPEVCK